MGEAILGVFAFTFCAIVAGILFHQIIGWFIEGAVSGIQCVAIAGVYVFAVITMITTGSMALRVILACVVIAGVALLPMIGESIRKKEDTRYYDDKIEGYREAIARDPRNLAARSRLAEALHKQGHLDDAISELSELVRIAPNSLQDAQRLRYLTELREEQAAPPRICPSCGEPNSPDRSKCFVCEADLNPMHEIREWLVAGGLKKVVISSSVAIGIITAVAMFASVLSPIGKITAIALTLLIVVGAEFLYIQRNF